MTISPPIEWQTGRLSIRRAITSDSGFILRLLNEPSWIDYIGDKHIRDLDAAGAYISRTLQGSYDKHGFGLMIVETRCDEVPIGLCGLIRRENLQDVDLGYAFLPEYWGKGYAFESASSVIKDGQDTHGLNRLVAITLPRNDACIRLLLRLGFTRESEILLGDDTEALELYGLDLAGGNH